MLIYTGSMFYICASYLHLIYNKEWSITKAYSIAIPVVLIEYMFSLHGIYYLNKYFNLEPTQIIIINMCFDFINLWLLNYFILKFSYKNIYKEILSLILIISALLLTDVIKT